MPSVAINTSTDGFQVYPRPGDPPLGPRQFVRCLGLDLTASGTAVVASLKSNNSTLLWESQAMNATTPGGIVLPVNKERTIDTKPGEPLTLGVSAGTLQGSIEVVVFGPPVS